MLARVAMPAVRQKRSKLAPTSCQASSMVATGTTAADVVGSFMALLSFVDSAPRAYRLKVGNACPPISTSNGTSPSFRNESGDLGGFHHSGAWPNPPPDGPRRYAHVCWPDV